MLPSIPMRQFSAGTISLSALLSMCFLLGGCESPAKTGWLGVNAQFSAPALAPSGPGPSLPACAGLLEELNVPLVRDMTMNWAAIQPRAGQPCDFAWPDRVVRRVQDAKADLLVAFGGVPDWACGGSTAAGKGPRVPDRALADAFAEFVRRFVERYDQDGREDMPKLAAPVSTFQFICEMEDIPPAEYAWWLKLFRSAVKSANPKATVVLGSLRSPGLKTFDEPNGDYPDYFERLLAEPELAGPGYPHFDVVAFDCFPARYPGRSPFDEPVAYLRQAMGARKLNQPVWLTAFGTSGGPEAELLQAESLVKWTVMVRALGIQRAYVYCLCDCRDPGWGTVKGCGLARETSDGTLVRKKALEAVTKMVREISDRPDVSFRGEGLYVLSGKDKPRYVVWLEEGVDASKTVLRGWWSVERVTGPKTVRQASEIRLTASPLIIERATSPFID